MNSSKETAAQYQRLEHDCGAIRSSEVGDGTYECKTCQAACHMIDAMEQDGDILTNMNQRILGNHRSGRDI